MARESTFMNMFLTLFIISIVSSASLGYIYEFTKEPIAKASLEKKINAIKEVVPAFNNNPIEEMKEVVISPDEKLIFYPAKNNSVLVGTAIETFSNKGYGGKIKLMVGFLPDGSIYDISVLEQKETPGLGDKMQKSKSDFSLQFRGKRPSIFKLQVKKDGGDVDAITAATISSRAFCDAVTRAHESYMKETKK